MSQRTYTRLNLPELERMYSHRHRIPDYDSYPERWSRSSRAALEEVDAIRDVAYGTLPLERYDVFPAGSDAPVLLFFHGGYWFSQDKANFLFPAPAFVRAGVAYASANYPLCPDVGMAALLDSCRRCVEHIYDFAPQIGADPDRLYLAGHSAGAHIAATLLSDLPPGSGCAAAVQGALAISGVYDLEPIALLEINRQLRLSSEDVELYSPIRNLSADAGLLSLAVGYEEGPEFRRQQSDFAEAWRAEVNPCDETLLPRANHFSILDSFAREDGHLFRAALDLMGIP